NASQSSLISGSAVTVGVGPSTPTLAIFPGRWAAAPNGAASTAPRPVTKARRFILRASGWRDASARRDGEQDSLGDSYGPSRPSSVRRTTDAQPFLRCRARNLFTSSSACAAATGWPPIVWPYI